MPKGIRGFQKGHKVNIGKAYTKGKHWKYPHPVTQDHKNKNSKANKGKHYSPNTEFKKGFKHTEEWKIKNGERMKGQNNPAWIDGSSYNPYPPIFNKELKLLIRTRDNFTCCLCGRTEREELEELNQVLCVNHIDFNKQNCTKENLNTLCLRCNVKINRKREYWTQYFNNLYS